jgi:hypothetical protein
MNTILDWRSPFGTDIVDILDLPGGPSNKSPALPCDPTPLRNLAWQFHISDVTTNDLNLRDGATPEYKDWPEKARRSLEIRMRFKYRMIFSSLKLDGNVRVFFSCLGKAGSVISSYQHKMLYTKPPKGTSLRFLKFIQCLDVSDDGDRIKINFLMDVAHMTYTHSPLYQLKQIELANEHYDRWAADNPDTAPK